MLFARLLQGFITDGELTLIDATGNTHRMGDPAKGPNVTIRLHDRSLHRKLFLDPRLAIGEAYMEGTLTVENASIYDFLALIGANLDKATINIVDQWLTAARMMLRRFQQRNSLGRARGNIAHHYDLSGALYDLFLDRDRQYSCGYFLNPGDDIEIAQAQKKHHLAAKLLLAPGVKVLDIGSGWGGLGLYLADQAGAEVVGITLSEEQLGVSRSRAEQLGLADRAAFFLRDYRDQKGTFDRIVSVGMFEHVGAPNYGTFFAKVAELLNDDGVALLHFISHMDPPCPANAWLDKYIFPGAYSPALSEVLPVIERAGLWVTDIEILRLHYAETLRHWRERFRAHWDEAAKLYDERFCRMWEFYLAGNEMTFRFRGQMIAQIQLATSIDAVPLTRDYITDWERRGTTEADMPDKVRDVQRVRGNR
jgi:cyclopropane-fatty-acyl-phospholipid synthase